MHSETIQYFSQLFDSKLKKISIDKSRMFASGCLAGSYVAISAILIMTLGTDVPTEWRKFITGISFGLALVLVIFAGSDLFTGYPLYAISNFFDKKFVDLRLIKRTLYLFLFIWIANLVGSCIVALLYKLGSGYVLNSADSFLFKVVSIKLHKSWSEQFFNGILCNWLVCLALWLSYKIKSDSGKIVAVSWCLFAFIASGYEHCVANMGLFALALLGPSLPDITLISSLSNLLFVTLGNLIGGGFFVGTFYGYISSEK